jgi:hypothetical protein
MIMKKQSMYGCLLVLISSLFLAACSTSLSKSEVNDIKDRARQITEQGWILKAIQPQSSDGNSSHWIHFVFQGDGGERIIIKRKSDSKEYLIHYLKLIEGDKITFSFEEPDEQPKVPTPVTYLRLHVPFSVLPEKPITKQSN